MARSPKLSGIVWLRFPPRRVLSQPPATGQEQPPAKVTPTATIVVKMLISSTRMLSSNQFLHILPRPKDKNRTGVRECTARLLGAASSDLGLQIVYERCT